MRHRSQAKKLTKTPDNKRIDEKSVKGEKALENPRITQMITVQYITGYELSDSLQRAKKTKRQSS